MIFERGFTLSCLSPCTSKSSEQSDRNTERRVLKQMNETHIGECNLSKTYAPMNKRYLKSKTSRYEGYNTQMYNHHVYVLSY